MNLEDLVRIGSETGNEQNVVAYLQAEAQEDGFDVAYDAVGNFIARTGGKGPHILFVGHVDTVPGDLPVFVEAGVLWGRGSVDAKGPLYAAYEAARRRMDANITIVGAVGEEGDSRGAKALEVAHPDLIVIGEPSGWDGVTFAYKGLLRGTLSWSAKPVHGGHPEPNAWDLFARDWAAIAKELSSGTGFEATHVRLDGVTSRHEHGHDIVTAAFQVRIPPSQSPRDVETALVSLAPTADVQVTDAIHAAESDKRSALAAAFRMAIRAEGGTPRLLRKTGTADFNLLAKRYPGVPMVAYGPGDSALDHTPDERIALEDVDRACRVWDAVLATVAPVETIK